MPVCIFCHNQPPPDLKCTYDLQHEYPIGKTIEQKQAQKQSKKIDVNVCTECALHRKHPRYASGECLHQHPPSI